MLKNIDLLIGKLLVKVISKQTENKVENFSSLLLIRPGGIGDAVLLAPAIRYLKKSNPSVEITVLAEQRNSVVFSMIPGVDILFCYDRPAEFIHAMRNSYDVVIDTEQWHRLSAVVARMVSAPVKIGFSTNERRRMFTHSLPYSHDDYEAASFNHLLKPLGIDADVVEHGIPFLSIPTAVVTKATNMLAAFSDKPFVIIFPGASITERRWGADRFRRVAELLSAFGIKIVVVGGKEDRQQGELIAGGGQGLNLAGSTSLSETAAIIQKSSLLLSGDSGVLHIAVGLGVPTVSLFGPGRVSKWAPQGDRHIVINKNLPCSPCTTFGTTPPCPINVQCMRDISVDEVFSAISLLLNRLGTVSFHD